MKVQNRKYNFGQLGLHLLQEDPQVFRAHLYFMDFSVIGQFWKEREAFRIFSKHIYV